MDVVVTA